MRLRFHLLAGLGCAALLGAQTADLPLEPFHQAGQSITGAFEGWYPNPDGTSNLLFGYMNRNFQESLDIPVGPNNHVDPGGPDRGQPTYFHPGANGVFSPSLSPRISVISRSPGRSSPMVRKRLYPET
jgi:hypothetical protein